MLWPLSPLTIPNAAIAARRTICRFISFSFPPDILSGNFFRLNQGSSTEHATPHPLMESRMSSPIPALLQGDDTELRGIAPIRKEWCRMGRSRFVHEFV